MDKKIGYYSFGDIGQCYGLAVCLYKNNIFAEHVSTATAKYYDFVLFSVFWWQHVIDFFDFCNRAKIGKKYNSKTKVVVGGFNTFNPVVFKNYAHAVVVGDGENIVANVINDMSHESIYTGQEKKVVWNNYDISNNSFIYQNERCIERIEIARGCKFKCKFCQLSAIKKYREVNIENIINLIRTSHGKRLSLFAPNKCSHSCWEKIKNEIELSGKIDTCPDVRFSDVSKFYYKTSMQIGIEGLSERLRYVVGKKLSDVDYLQIINDIINRGVHKKPHLFCGYILNLPEENEDDFNMFSEFLDKVSSIPGASNFTMFFIFNMFMPMPFTQYEDSPINPTIDYASKIKKCLYDRKIKICVRGRLFSNYSRILSMICTRLGEECETVLNEVEKTCKKYTGQIKADIAIQTLKKIGFLDILECPKKKPWDVVCLS